MSQDQIVIWTKVLARKMSLFLILVSSKNSSLKNFRASESIFAAGSFEKWWWERKKKDFPSKRKDHRKKVYQPMVNEEWRRNKERGLCVWVRMCVWERQRGKELFYAIGRLWQRLTNHHSVCLAVDTWESQLGSLMIIDTYHWKFQTSNSTLMCVLKTSLKT